MTGFRRVSDSGRWRGRKAARRGAVVSLGVTVLAVGLGVVPAAAAGVTDPVRQGELLSLDACKAVQSSTPVKCAASFARNPWTGGPPNGTYGFHVEGVVNGGVLGNLVLDPGSPGYGGSGLDYNAGVCVNYGYAASQTRYLGFSLQRSSAGGTTFGASGAYMYRLTGPWPGAPSDTTALDARCVSENPFSNVPPPAVDCYREFFKGTSGSRQVRVRAVVANPRPGAATDVANIRFPWESFDRDGGFEQDAALPENTPQGGWRGLCKVTRTLAAGATGTTGWRSGAQVVEDVPPESLSSNPKSMQNVFYSAPVQTLQPWVLAPGAAMTVGAAAAADTASAVVGWVTGGYIIGKINWHGDDEWFCRHNPGYRTSAKYPSGVAALAGRSYCEMLTDRRPFVRAQGQFRDASGTPLDGSVPAAWRSTTTVTEVVIDPPSQVQADGSPNDDTQAQGSRTTAGFDTPTQTATEVTTMQTAEGNEAGVARATSTATADPDPHPAPASATSTADLADGCNQSFWQLLNPLNIAETMGCVLRKLFVPTGTALQDLRSSYSSGLGSVLNFPIGVMRDGWVAFGSSAASASGGCTGPTVHVPGAGFDGFDVQPLNVCDGVPKTVSESIRPVLNVMIWVLSLLSCVRLIAGSFGLKLWGGTGEAVAE